MFAYWLAITLDLTYIKNSRGDKGLLCLLSLAVFGPNTFCNYDVVAKIQVILIANMYSNYFLEDTNKYQVKKIAVEFG